MTKRESLETIKKLGLDEEYVFNLIVTILGQKTGSMILIKGLDKEAYLDTNLKISYNGVKRYFKLEEAIKTIALQ